MAALIAELAELKKEQSVIDSFWEGANSQAAAVLHHPFMLGMLTQTLPSSCSTDYFIDQAHVFANVLNVSKYKRESSPVTQEPNYLGALRSVFQHLEIRDTKEIGTSSVHYSSTLQVSPAAEEMKQYLEEKSQGESNSEALLTWSGIIRLREFLERTIGNSLPRSGARNNPCGVWLNAFAKSQFEACKAMMEEELMKILPATMSPTEMEQLQCVFNTVLRYELALLESAFTRNCAISERADQRTSAWHPSNIIFTTDFDVTCTVVDSCETLVRAAETAALRKSTQGNDQSVYPGKFFEDYEAALLQHTERTRKVLYELEHPEERVGSIAPPQSLMTESQKSSPCPELVAGMDPLLKPFFTVIERVKDDEKSSPFDEAGLRRALKKLATLEVLCNQDVMDSGVLSGSNRQEIRTEAKKVGLRAHCAEVLQQLADIGTGIHIVSANWSRDLIIGGLPELPEGKLFTHCNDLLFDSSGISRGLIDGTVVDAFDKENLLQALRPLENQKKGGANLQAPSPETQIQEVAREEKQGKKMLVYLGDSHTDLLGLLEADLGIVIGESPVVRRIMALYGIQLLPLVEASAHISIARLNGTQCSYRRSGILFEAQNWVEVQACLFGQCEVPDFVSPSSAELKKPMEERRSQAPRSQEHTPPLKLDLVRVTA